MRVKIGTILGQKTIVAVLVLAFAVWALAVPVPIRNPFANSPLLKALENSNAKRAGAYRFTQRVDDSTLRRLFPVTSTMDAAQTYLGANGFVCEPRHTGNVHDFQAPDRWYLGCKRVTSYHPLFVIGWKVEVIATRDGALEDVSAWPYYDGP